MRVTTIATAGLVLGVSFLCGGSAMAQAPETESSEVAPVEQADAGPKFTYQGGEIVLPNKVATLHLGDKYRYLSPADTEKLLVAWGNEPGNDTQGAIIPGDVDPMADDGWAVILSYDNDGHVDDAEAKDIDYNDLLADMKEGTEDNNKARKDAGYKSVHLIGWAEAPRYDAQSKKLYWAKEFAFEGSQNHTLNYDVRVLGREGVLSMNAVAGIGQLSQIRGDMQPLIKVAEFNEGHRYVEFNSKTDRMAEYGLGALIAGGVAAKMGLFAKLGVMLLALKKFILIALVAIGGFFSKLFGKKKDPAV